MPERDREDRPLPRGRREIQRRLEEILAQVNRSGLEQLGDRQVEDLGRLYRASANELALQRSFGASTRSREELNRLVSRAHARIYGRPSKGAAQARWLHSLLAFPETVRRTIRYHAAAVALLVAGGFYGFLGADRDPEWALELVTPTDDRTPYASREELLDALMAGRPLPAEAPDPGADESPEAKQSRRTLDSDDKAVFAAFLWQHNTKVALVAFFSGVLAGVPTLLVLLLNGAFLGVYTHTFHARGLAFEWWAWILPHGVTELLAIALLSGGGLWIGHLILRPGERSRTQALREARADVVRLLVFAFAMLLLAALIESFVRQSGLSDRGRYVFAALSAVAWALYLGLARAPAAGALETRRTAAERAVALPIDEDLRVRGR